MEQIQPFIQNLPGAVWIVVGIVVIVSIVMIAQHGSQAYGMSMIFNLNMFLCFLTLVFVAGAILYYAEYIGNDMAPTNATINFTIVMALGAGSFLMALFRNIGQSTALFGLVFTLTQMLLACFFILAILLIFNRDKKEHYG